MSQKTASEKVGKPVPQCKAILLCERVIMEAGTGKVNLIGVVHKFVFPSLPAQTQPMTAYLQLVEGIGRYNITAEVWDLTTGQSLAQGQGAAVEFQDRLAVIQLLLPLPPLPLHHEGSFDVVVFANGQEIDRQKFTVTCALAGGNA